MLGWLPCISIVSINSLAIINHLYGEGLSSVTHTNTFEKQTICLWPGIFHAQSQGFTVLYPFSQWFPNLGVTGPQKFSWRIQFVMEVDLWTLTDWELLPKVTQIEKCSMLLYVKNTFCNKVQYNHLTYSTFTTYTCSLNDVNTLLGCKKTFLFTNKKEKKHVPHLSAYIHLTLPRLGGVFP